MRLAATLGAIALVSAAPIGAVAAESEDPAPAIREFNAAQAAYDAGKFSDALKHYLASYRLGHDAAVLFSVAECYRQLESFAKARSYYLRYLKELPNAPYADLVRDQVKELDAKIAEARTPQPATHAELASTPEPARAAQEPLATEEPKPGSGDNVAVKPEGGSEPASASTIETDVPTAQAPFGVPAGSAVGVVARVPPVKDARSPLLTEWWFWTAVVAVVAAGSVAGYFVFRPSGPTPTLGTVNGQ